MFIVSLSFIISLATKFPSLNDDPWMVRPTLIDLSPFELKYYPFIITLDKCSGTCNVLSSKICIPRKTKDINVNHLIW